MGFSALQSSLLLPLSGLRLTQVPAGMTVVYHQGSPAYLRPTNEADLSEVDTSRPPRLAISWAKSLTHAAQPFSVELPRIYVESLHASPSEGDSQPPLQESLREPVTQAKSGSSMLPTSILIEKAQQAMVARRLTDAASHWQEILSRSRARGRPSRSALLYLGLIYRKLDQLDASETNLRELVSLNGHSRHWCELAVTLRLLAKQQLALNNIECADQHLDEAKDAIARASELNPKVPRHRCEEALILLEVARLERAENDLEEAMAYYNDALAAIDEALALNGHARHISTKGIILSEMGPEYTTQARHLLEQGIARNRSRHPEPLVEAYEALITLYRRRGNDRRADALEQELQDRLRRSAVT